ncbi:MAG: ATP-dependent Clp protease proteolytic subunit [Deltaproteobacteria bacterium]|nr:ATP-dependent Clp protease proteolytic subunit [Candidatus Tharpella aukensis]
MSSHKDERQEKGLSDYGIIYLSGQISEGTSESICKEIIEFNIKGETDYIQMIINSPGGSCTAGFAIIDMMEWSNLPIYTTGIGMIASMGLLIFMTGAKNRRVITQRTSILSHRFSGLSFGNHSQLLASRKEEDLTHQRIIDHYLRYTNFTDKTALEKELLQDVDTWLSSEEAIKYGIADKVEGVNHG